MSVQCAVSQNNRIVEVLIRQEQSCSLQQKLENQYNLLSPWMTQAWGEGLTPFPTDSILILLLFTKEQVV